MFVWCQDDLGFSIPPQNGGSTMGSKLIQGRQALAVYRAGRKDSATSAVNTVRIMNKFLKVHSIISTGTVRFDSRSYLELCVPTHKYCFVWFSCILPVYYLSKTTCRQTLEPPLGPPVCEGLELATEKSLQVSARLPRYFATIISETLFKMWQSELSYFRLSVLKPKRAAF
ncbi:hypothetical protein PoB_002162000 [Plakobranchus ocellatus]|uniref:Uncharacterized protein n=1 Tax=Plakobranchus ocellatus TaxID=259542 RepID=A0AAV3ZJ09_9GAST|nr:hypothetical protein PoB_002162000 [Plakobranchus ocellatus]